MMQPAGAKRAAHPNRHLRWKTEPTAALTRHVLRAAAALYMTVIVWLVVLLVHGIDVRNPGAVAAGTVGVAVFFAFALHDLHVLRTGDVQRLRPVGGLLEVAAATASFALFAVGFGPEGGAAFFFVCVPAVAAAFFASNTLLAGALVCTVAALAGDATALYTGRHAATIVIAFAATTVLITIAVHRIVNAAVGDMDRMSTLARLAASASTLRFWPGDLGPLGADVAGAMDVDRFAVVQRSHLDNTEEIVFAWPDGCWIDTAGALDVAATALRTKRSTVQGALLATPMLWSTRPAPILQTPTVRAPDPSATTTGHGTPDLVVVTPAKGRTGDPIDPHQTATVVGLLAAMAGRAGLVDNLVALANTDELTGLANRRRFFEVLDHTLARARRAGEPVSVAMIDLDHFKVYNDEYGHGAGDDLLRRFATAVGQHIRDQDLLARYGGEEFVMVLPATDAIGAEHLLQQVRRSQPATDPVLEVTITFSAGAATWDGTESAEQLVRRADEQLYEAKTRGRDQVVVAR